MREISFAKRWEKLEEPEFTTFRMQRRDKDWQLGERVKVVYHARQKDREVLGIADIVRMEEVDLKLITLNEAVGDGFQSVAEMVTWLLEVHGARLKQVPLHKLTLQYLVARK